MLFRPVDAAAIIVGLIVLLSQSTALGSPVDVLPADVPVSRIAAAPGGRHVVEKLHPRLLGSRQRLQQLAKEREQAYRRVVDVARNQGADAHAKMISLGLVSAIEQDRELGREAIGLAMKIVGGPIRQGHVTFGSDLAQCALVYDLCHEYWSPEERLAFHQYMNRTVDANVLSETHVFHNAWYGYKNWGIGLACYATFYENPRAVSILRDLEQDYLTRAAPALELAGAGGGWAEGYYVNYWLYEWLFFCEAARWCEGVDYYAAAPRFYHERAIASMFETYPGIGTYNSQRSIPIGDGGGRTFGGDRDKILAARRVLVDFYRDDPGQQAVHDFNERTPRSSVGVYAYKDFLWRNPAVPRGSLDEFRLSHMSPGPGYVYARSNWQDDATYFFFKCGNRFTAHQHLDVGNFLIFKHEELVGDGGHYDGFGTPHDVNYHLRSIAHNTILVHDPSETWPGIRGGNVTGNDGGQAHNWPHHNGAVSDPAAWHQDHEKYEIGSISAFEDRGDYLYVAGDCSTAYSPEKLQQWVRQIVMLRPGTFVVFDRVIASDAKLKKTWLLQAMKRPDTRDSQLVITNGQGRLFVQPLLPRERSVQLRSGDQLYQYDGQSFPPQRDTGPAPECRIEIVPTQSRQEDLFLHVLTATGSNIETVPNAVVDEGRETVKVQVGDTTIVFSKNVPGGSIVRTGRVRQLADGLARE